MVRNYILVAWRNITRNKLISVINISGLALAMTVAILIYLFVADELSFDRYHRNADRIFRVTRIFFDKEGSESLHLASVAPPIGPLLKNDFGEIEAMARTLQFNVTITHQKNNEDISLQETNLFLAEPALFNILDIKVLAGDPAKDFQRPFTGMLSETTALRYFNSTDVIGRRLKINNVIDMEVVGVFKDFPAQTHWHPDFLVSFTTLEDDNIYGRQNLETNWGNNSFSTYLLLTHRNDAPKLTAAFPAFIDKHFGSFARANFGVPEGWVASKTTKLTLQKVTDIHLRSHLDDEIEVNGNINNVYMMSVIGIFILLIACFNFVNLSTAHASKRRKEVGLRKTVGAGREQLITQHLSESILVALLALILAITFSWIAVDWLNQFTSKSLSLAHFFNTPFGLALLAFAILVGGLAGIYPAFVISSYRPALALKGQQASASGRSTLRQVLVVSQFGISIVLLIATIVTYQQLQYLNARDLGFDREQVVTLPYYNELDEAYEAFYNEMLASTSIKNVARSSRIPTGRLLDSRGQAMVTQGDSLVTTAVGLKYVSVDHEFFDTYNIEWLAGRPFSKEIITDDSLAYIVNETAAHAFGWKQPVQSIDKDFQYGGTRGKLIGIVKDFHFESLHQPVVPMVFIPVRQQGFNFVSVKIAAQQMQEGLAHMEKLWKQMVPGRPFAYQFMDQRYERLYTAEQKAGTLFTLFAAMAIFIACLGLFGLATFNSLQRLKEIGVRKVFGASVPSILLLLSREILWLIALANLMAWPLAWYLMTQWLTTFAYHINISFIPFAIAAIGAVALALATVSYQTTRAALANPAKTLRYE